MRAFSGAILGPSHDVLSPTVARIEGERLYLSSPDGTVEQWRLDRVEIIQVAAGYFEVVAKDRRLALVLDEPEAFGEAIQAERGSAPEPSRTAARRSHRTRSDRSSLLVKRPRHGLPSLRLGPLLAVLAVALVVVMIIGATFGNLIDLSTTESGETPDLPATEVVVRTFQGEGTLRSGSFAVEAPWKLEWSLAEEAATEARLSIVAVSQTGLRLPVAAQQGAGAGEATLEESGVFSLEITAVSGQWSVRVLELVNAEPG